MDDLTNIILENKNLIYKISMMFTNYTNKEDLFQVGCIGLINAYKKYDKSFNTKFTTYAYPYIFGEMNNYVKKDKGIKISREISKLNSMIERVSILLTQKYMREPSIKEIALYLEIDENLVIEAMKSRNLVKSIDSVINEDGKEITLLDTIADVDKMDLNTLIALKEELIGLTEEERKIVIGCLINDKNQQQIADEMGMSQVQVSRKLTKVKNKIKYNLMC